MIYHSQEHIAAILRLEEQCNQLESITIHAGIEHLAKENGDRALLCYRDDQLAGLLSWYTVDGVIATINAMVHPDFRRQGVFRSLLQRAKADMQPLGIQRLSYRIPQGSEAGFTAAQSLGAVFNRSEYSMTYAHSELKPPRDSDLRLCPAEPQDFEFMVACSSQAFGDSEAWTREYFTRTNEPSRTTNIAWLDHIRVGLIRFNSINESTVFIHDFCIWPSNQGKGLGTKVLKSAVELLLNKQYTQIRLGVVTENKRALNLYLDAGFEIVSELHYYTGGLSG
ncbi:GNAT family N-acetyltransferase [Paenibacillus sp. sgz500958]|uniref:GNAT family N-acetyltransferase n=1 Tax=Paenibacillus sp. sgz500958 TaxID=3242475 RepID=UPI0036D2B040